MVNRVEKAAVVGVKHPLYRLRHQRRIQRAKRLMRASTGAKPIREAPLTWPGE